MIRITLLTLSLALPAALLGCDGKDGGGGDDTSAGTDGGGTTDGGTAEGDADGDGYVDAALGGDDCDDSDPAINPAADEICDDVDNDCNDAIDDDAVDAPSWYVDSDSDGYGDVNSNSFTSCDETPGLVSQGGDCDDGDGAINPGATEICDSGVDNDCDGAADALDPDVDLTDWYRDADYDGYGDPKDVVEDCEEPVGFVANAGDCDDDDGAINPDAAEVCDGFDNDCDPATSEEGTVTLDELSAYTSIQEALDAASSGSEIVVCDGTYSEALDVPVSVTLRSANGPEVTVIDAGGAGSVIDVDSSTAGSVRLEVIGFTLTGGIGTVYASGDLNGDGLANDTIGGAINGLYTADLTVEDCIIDGNTAVLAGGVLGSGYLGGDTFTDTIFQNNIATESIGGGLYTFDAELVGAEFSGNEGVNGGGVFMDGSAGGALVADAGTRFINNSSLYGGGVLLSTADFLADPATEFTGNTATYDKGDDIGGFGGAIYAGGVNSSSQLVDITITGGTFTDNTAVWGGGGVLAYGNIAMEGATFDGNTSEVYGGGVYLVGLAVTLPSGAVDYVTGGTFADTTFSGNAASEGGAIYAPYADVALTDSTLSGNSADTWGGGALVADATMTMSGGGVTGNTAPIGGGVALYNGTLSVTASDWGEGKTDNSLDDVALGYLPVSDTGDTGDTGDDTGGGGPTPPSPAPDTGDTGGGDVEWISFDEFGASASFSCDTETLSCE